jgi:hypothetical protein
LIGGLCASVVSSDRFLIKILDSTVSFQDLTFQLRNLKALKCIYEDALVIKTFEGDFVKELDTFVSKFPTKDAEIRRYLHKNETILKDIRIFFKMLRYSEDQKSDLSPKLTKLIRESAKVNKCNSEVLYKDTLKTNFISLMETELYLRARYGGQLKNNQKFESIRSSIDLFIESLDKQFTHEYYW